MAAEIRPVSPNSDSVHDVVTVRHGLSAGGLYLFGSLPRQGVAGTAALGPASRAFTTTFVSSAAKKRRAGSARAPLPAPWR